MIQQKKKPCKSCGNDSYIFSKGKCRRCSESGSKGLKSGKKGIKKITEKKLKEKQETREIRDEYFEHHINRIKNNSIVCQECGDNLKGQISEIAHIIKKSTNPEIEKEDENILYLCGIHSVNQCHSKFDQSLSKRETMRVFIEVLNRFESLESKIIRFTKEVRHILKNI